MLPLRTDSALSPILLSMQPAPQSQFEILAAWEKLHLEFVQATVECHKTLTTDANVIARKGPDLDEISASS
jgi:hypothetical protein